MEAGDYLAARWAEFEKTALERSETHQNGKEARLVYAVIENGALVTDRTLMAGVYPGEDSYGIRLDAETYFTLYHSTVEYSPQITPQEALELLSPLLSAAGEPGLVARQGGAALVYVIPVTGVKWVDKVYINAVTGRYEGMEYDYGRP